MDYMELDGRCPRKVVILNHSHILRIWVQPTGTKSQQTEQGAKRKHIPWSVFYSLHWRHDERDGVSNHRRLDCLLNRSLMCRSKKTSKLRVTGLCEGNSPVTGEFPTQRASNAGNVSIWWRHHVMRDGERSIEHWHSRRPNSQPLPYEPLTFWRLNRGVWTMCYITAGGLKLYNIVKGAHVIN